MVSCFGLKQHNITIDNKINLDDLNFRAQEQTSLTMAFVLTIGLNCPTRF